MSHTVPHKALYKNQGVILPEKPRGKYRGKCAARDCDNEWDSRYVQTKFCSKVCSRVEWSFKQADKQKEKNKGKKPKQAAPAKYKTKSQISMINSAKRKAKEQKAIDFTILQRGMFSKRL